MQKTKFTRPPVASKTSRKSQTIPNQTLSIAEIVRRFVRNLEVDVPQNPKIYIDQEDLDLERLSRLDRSDKAFEAVSLREQAGYLQQKVQENERKLKEQANAKARAAQVPKPPETKPSIVVP